MTSNFLFISSDFTFQMMKFEELEENENEKRTEDELIQPIPEVEFVMLISKDGELNKEGLIIEGEVRSQEFVLENIKLVNFLLPMCVLRND